MARIAGVNVPDHKHTVISLTYVFGIGRPTAQKICADLKIEESTKVSDLGEEKFPCQPLYAYEKAGSCMP